MKFYSHTTIAILVACSILFNGKHVISDPNPFAAPPVDLVYPVMAARSLMAQDLPGNEMTDRGREIRGVYIPVGKLVTAPFPELIQWVVDEVGANAVILDLKDDQGRVTFSRDITGARNSSHGFIKDMKELIAAFKQKDIYVIGRIVCFKDNFLSKIRPDTAILDRRTGKRWMDKGRFGWVDPYSPFAREFIADIARAGQEVGVDEIQLDYIRFPVEPGANYGRYPNRVGTTPRYEAIAAVLARVDHEISIPLSIDVFGLTAYRTGDPGGLGQSLEHLAPYIDAISPMLYLANWPRPTWENPKPSRTHSLVHNAVARIRSRLGDQIAVRPLLQGFSYRAKNFGESFIYNQIDAAQTAGSSGHLFWNQGGKYTLVASVWRDLDAGTPPPANFRETEE